MKVLSKERIFYRGEGAGQLDVDVDFSANPITGLDRHAIFQHLQKKFNKGKDVHIALVGTRTVYSIKSALRDVGRTYDIPPSEIFAVTKVIDEDRTVEDNARKIPQFKKFVDKYPDAVRIASQISGVTSNFGVHAGGIVISGDNYPIQKYVPLQRSASQMPATLYDKDELQGECGFIKYDILQVTALSQIQYVKNLLGDEEIYKDYEEIPEPFSLVPLGHHKNIFQFESGLGKRCFNELKMNSIYDLSNASGMIRQMGTEGGRAMYEKYKIFSTNDDNFWREQLKNEVSSQTFSIIEPILARTYGVLIYQEQLSSMVEKLSKGKYTFGDGNDVRKKLGKMVGKHGLVDSLQGKRDKLKAWHTDVMDVLNKYLIPFLHEDDLTDETKKFINFELEKGDFLAIPEIGIINWFVIGSTYLFSVIHSVAYSIVSYNQLYQKYFYPTEFWLSALHCGSKDDIQNYISGAKNESKIQILPPNINNSEISFSKEGDRKIRFGLGYIAGLDKAAVAIINERNKNGPFKSTKDLMTRMKGERSFTKKIIENLIFCEAMPEPSKDAYEIYCREKNLENDLGWTEKEMRRREVDSLSVAISNDPFKKIKDLSGTVSVDSILDGTSELCAFVVNSVTDKKTKTNKSYKLLNISCVNSGTSTNLFLWDVSLSVGASDSFVAYLKRKDGFLSWDTYRKK
jgi:DNA polymerase-3 subunit alpha